MSTDIEIKASEAYLTTIDVTSAGAGRTLSTTSAMWYCQVFLADSHNIPRIFFMADIDITVDWANNLKIEIWNLTSSGSGTSQTFTLDSLIQTFTGPYESLSTDSNETNPITEALWYYIDSNLTVTQNDYYAMVFKSNDSSPKIYFSNEYRQSIFVQIMASNDSGTTWSNGIVPTQSTGKMRTGAVCCGYVGDEITATNSFDSGDVTIGGTISANRGYSTYIYVENLTSQANRRNNISIDFTMIPPTDTSTYGTSKETDQSMMRWYSYSSGVLPLSSDSYLYKTLDSSPVLDSTADFVMFMQPDRLSPHGVVYFPETEVGLSVNEIGLVPIYEGTTSLGSDESIIFDNTNRMSAEYWAQFTSQSYEDAEESSSNTNPTYIDLSLEKRNKDVEVFGKITLNTADASRIRGFSHIVLYKNFYIAFPKFLADSDDPAWSASYPNGAAAREFIVYVASYSDTSTWTRTIMPITDSPGTSVRGNDNIVIGVHDVVVKNTGSSSNTETMFIIFQTYPSGAPNNPLDAFFDIAYTTESILSNSLTVQALDIEDEHIFDGEFTFGSATTDIDYQAVKFISPNTGSNLYVTARNRNASVDSATIVKFGLWSLDLTSIIAASTSVAKINTSDVYYGSSNNLNYRGFDPNITHESEISYILHDGSDTYLGMDTADNVFVNDAANSKNASVYITSDFSSFDQIIDGNKDQSWCLSGITNSRIVFMIMVERILHIWMSNLGWGASDNPYHIAHDVNTYTTRLLRRFPIEDVGDSNYATDEKVSHLEIYGRSKYIRQFIGGAVNGHYIYIYGLDGYQDQYTMGVRWVMYDDRMLNQAFEYYDDKSYHSWTPSVDSGYEAAVKETFALKTVSGANVGVYNGKTMGKYPFEETAFVWDDYPDIPAYTERASYYSRIGAYCGIVSSASNYNNGLYSIDNDNSNVNPRLVVQSGISYLICDHYTKGCQVYKTYGIKQLPENWGSGTANGPDIDVDKSCYLKCNSAYSSLRKYLRTCAIDKLDGTNYIMELKENNYEAASYGYNTNFVDSNEPDRYLMRISSGTNKVQNISWYYRFMQTANYVAGDAAEFALSGSALTQSETNIKLKTANTLEDLFFNPEESTIWLGDDTTSTSTDHKIFVNYTFPGDIESNFIRLETGSIKAKHEVDNPNDLQVNIMVKGLKANDLDFEGPTGTTATKTVAINGIVHGATIPEVGHSIVTDPQNVIANPSSRGVYLSPGGEIIVNFPKPIFINEISFKAYYDGSGSSSEDYSEFYFYFIPVFEKQTYGEGLIDDSDWVQIIDPVTFDPSENSSTISADSLSMYAQTIKIAVQSGLTIRINDFTVKSLGGEEDQFQASGNVTNPELIVIDDLEAIIVGRQGGTRAAAYATMSNQDDYIIVDIGNIAGYNGVPITRISMNISGIDTSTRTLSVDTWDGSTYDGYNYQWENVKTFPVQDYQYSFVSWSAEEKDKSKKVKITTLTGDNIPSNLSDILVDANNYSNFSSLFSSNSLQKYSFKPNIYKDRSLTVLSSGEQDDYDGYIKVNSQMDADGPFAGDTGSIGLLEKNVNIDFPLKQIRMIRITLLNSGEDILRINGLKTYTPLLNSSGDAIWPKATVVWTIKLNAYISG